MTFLCQNYIELKVEFSVVNAYRIKHFSETPKIQNNNKLTTYNKETKLLYIQTIMNLHSYMKNYLSRIMI